MFVKVIISHEDPNPTSDQIGDPGVMSKTLYDCDSFEQRFNNEMNAPVDGDELLVMTNDRNEAKVPVDRRWHTTVYTMNNDGDTIDRLYFPAYPTDDQSN